MKEPKARIVGPKPEDDITIIGNCDSILRGREISLLKVTFEQTSSVQVKSVLQIDFLHILVRRAANTDDVISIAVQVEGVRQVCNLN